MLTAIEYTLTSSPPRATRRAAAIQADLGLHIRRAVSEKIHGTLECLRAFGAQLLSVQAMYAGQQSQLYPPSHSRHSLIRWAVSPLTRWLTRPVLTPALFKGMQVTSRQYRVCRCRWFSSGATTDNHSLLQTRDRSLETCIPFKRSRSQSTPKLRRPRLSSVRHC